MLTSSYFHLFSFLVNFLFFSPLKSKSQIESCKNENVRLTGENQHLTNALKKAESEVIKLTRDLEKVADDNRYLQEKATKARAAESVLQSRLQQNR